ncbi:glycoside hydrolase family 35 protein [Paenibacillus flagellatus]|uniref:Beta-galactosidase n=1 Tax=Paenibacillus flagellatus TaxID=2211139 RepID=A0A2V5JY91_9BACL|nr:glycoside hydrolase family 35 protein [Paenibacillus flagellatus]PYI51788.1 beta-galactosidase [Paenibacillus flagellatus]
MATLETKGGRFVYDGKPVRLLSGAIHYFRTVPEYWRDRLLKLKACGFNTVETYVAWNVHEPQPGRFDFEGIADIERFIRTAGELGLFVIVRPSPYICAEWEFGGLPAWLLADPGMKLRCYHKPFLDRVDAYFDELLPRLVPLQSTNGGPIIAMQIENEYGSYGNDIRYLNHLRQSMIERGVDVLLFTSDGPTDAMLQGGTVPGVLATVNFGSRVGESFAKLREYQADEPVMCMEYWNGWFDHWFEHHHTRDGGDVANVLEEMLKEDASVNFYMFHGGTNFGFYNGANCPAPDQYQPTITSYDYDVLLTEAGEPTAKYFKVREVLSRYADVPETPLPAPAEKAAYGRVRMTGQADLFANLDALSSPIRSTCPEPMETYGQNYGFIQYTTRISGPRPAHQLNVQNVADRALVFVDGRPIGTIERWNKETKLSFEVPAEGVELTLLVENMGRINYGSYLRDPKGVTEGVRFGYQFLFDWTVRTLPLDDLSKVAYSDVGPQDKPAFYRGTFEAEKAADTFLYLEGWTKGVVWVNGFNLGRYWNVGPQKSLYVPGPLLRPGTNEVVVFELHGCEAPEVEFKAEPDLGPTEKAPE